MVDIKLNNNTISVPTAWSELTLADYEQWYIHPPKNNADQLACIAHLCKVELEELKETSPHLFAELWQAMSFLGESEFAPSQKVTIDKEDYFVSSSDDLTLGEWVDIDTILGDNDSLTKLSDLLAIVCRPLGERYDHKQVATRAQLFRAQPCDRMMPLVSFFLRREQNLKETFNHFSTVLEAGNQLLEVTKSFAQNGDGIKRLPIWQRIRFYFLTRSLEKQLSKFSVSSSIE